MSILQCPKKSYILVEQHANLYRQCNDLTDGYRMNASRSNQLYSTTCYWFLTDPSGIWRVFQTDWGIASITAYLYTVQSRFIRERQRSQRRRRQLHKAIMSSCRQDIAMAIRAKMTVI
uniref:G_PROTEIN_RECEP_F1_2 domain-containing protein n=1 Tax=Heterorhabditis bacteriophora TaxID=37862 RepID=A0A1I7XGX6_HETBA